MIINSPPCISHSPPGGCRFFSVILLSLNHGAILTVSVLISISCSLLPRSQVLDHKNHWTAVSQWHHSTDRIESHLLLTGQGWTEIPKMNLALQKIYWLSECIYVYKLTNARMRPQTPISTVISPEPACIYTAILPMDS